MGGDGIQSSLRHSLETEAESQCSGYKIKRTFELSTDRMGKRGRAANCGQWGQQRLEGAGDRAGPTDQLPLGERPGPQLWVSCCWRSGVRPAGHQACAGLWLHGRMGPPEASRGSGTTMPTQRGQAAQGGGGAGLALRGGTNQVPSPRRPACARLSCAGFLWWSGPESPPGSSFPACPFVGTLSQ